MLLTIVVDEKGVPDNISVTRPIGLGFDEKAKEAVSQWQFNPETKAGTPVEVTFRLLKDSQ